jgi:hypothetical protein
MADNDRYAPTKPRVIPDWEAEEVQETLQLFRQLSTYRNVFAAQWEETAALILPTYRNKFFYGSYNFPGVKYTQQQVDSSGARALHRFVAIVNSLVTPRNLYWHGLEAKDPYVMKDRATKLWFEEATRVLFTERYEATANFFSQNKQDWQLLGAFGNHTMFIDRFDGRWHGGAKGLRYKSVPLGETFFAENHQGIVDTVVRWFRGTAAQAAQKWGVENLPANLRPALEMNSQNPYDFLHCVKPRDEDDYDPDRLDAKGKPFESYYVSMQGMCLMPDRETGEYESGFDVFPYAIGRYDQAPGEVYARGPAQIVLPTLKLINAMKTTSLKAGHRAVDPVYLLGDDGIAGDFRPGAKNYGAVTADGKPLVHALQTGNHQIDKDMRAEETAIIDDVFMVELFRTLRDNQNMTLGQVIELVNERGMLVAPTLGGQFEYVSQMTERELDLAMRMGLLPPPPPRLREAGGAYRVTDTSPLAMAAKAGSVAGAMRIIEQLREVVNVTQDQSILDFIDWDTLGHESAEIQGMPTRWTLDDRAIAQKRQARAQQQAKQDAIAAAPAQAAMIKARAVAATAGGIPQQPGVVQ